MANILDFYKSELIKNVKSFEVNILTLLEARPFLGKSNLWLQVRKGLAYQKEWVNSRFFKIRLGLYNKKFQRCLINYLGLSYEQTVTSQLYSW